MDTDIVQGRKDLIAKCNDDSNHKSTRVDKTSPNSIGKIRKSHLTLVVGLFFVFLSRLVGVFEQVLPKTTVPNHSMLGTYPIRVGPVPCLEYTRAYTRAFWYV